MEIGGLIDQAKRAAGTESDGAFAKHMRVSHGTISHWRSGRAYPNAVSCERLAGLTGVPLVQVIALVGEARAISREEKAVWRKLAASAAVLILALSPWATPAAKAEIHLANQRITTGEFPRLPLMLKRQLLD